MGLENFNTNLWAASILDNVERNGALLNIAQNEYSRSGIVGNRVKINSIGDITVSNYTKGSKLSYEPLDSKGQWMDLDKQKAIAFLVDKVDLAQSSAGLGIMNKATEKSAQRLVDAASSTLAGLVSNAGNSITKTDVTSAIMNSIISSAKAKLRRGGAGSNERMWVALSPEVYMRLYLAKLVTDTNNSKLMESGIVGRTNGMDIYTDNSIQDQGSSQYLCMAGTYDAIAFADNVNNMSVGDHPDYHAMYVKGLYVYGAKVINAKKLVKIDLTLTDETAV